MLPAPGSSTLHPDTTPLPHRSSRCYPCTMNTDAAPRTQTAANAVTHAAPRLFQEAHSWRPQLQIEVVSSPQKMPRIESNAARGQPADSGFAALSEACGGRNPDRLAPPIGR